MGLIAQDTNKSNKIMKMCPSYMDSSNIQYLLLDNMFVASLLITNYEMEMEGGFLEKIINIGIDMQISIHYERQNYQDVLKKITYQIGNVGASIKETNDNQLDKNVIYKTYEDAKYIKNKMQIDGEELYEISIYIVIYESSLTKLKNSLKRVESLVHSVGLTSIRALFKQEESFLGALPIMTEEPMLKKITHRNVLTEGASSTYPFLAFDFYDENGIFIGISEENHSITLLNRFNTQKYGNANMFVIGTSGSGKSYFTKLMLIRNHYQNITQYVIDPDREYIKICQKLHGTVIDFRQRTINIMDIRESTKDGEESYLESKLRKLNAFFKILFHDMTTEEESRLEEILIKVYQKYHISFDDQTLYHSNGVFKRNQDMPRLIDVYELLMKDKKLLRLSVLLKPCVFGGQRYLNTHTNVDLNNTIVVTDVFGIEEQDLPQVLFIVTEFYWDMIKKNRLEKKILYFDEAWKLMNQNTATAEFIFKLFKTIRKFGGAATIVTQDINDFFRLEDGKYGKGVLSNASLKCVFSVEENEMITLEHIMGISDKEKERISRLHRGECLLFAGRERLVLKVEASPLEHSFITTDREELKNGMK